LKTKNLMQKYVDPPPKQKAIYATDSYAIGFVSFREDNPIQIEVTLDSFGLDNADGYTLNVS
jgi:hypothetical protein